MLGPGAGAKSKRAGTQPRGRRATGPETRSKGESGLGYLLGGREAATSEMGLVECAFKGRARGPWRCLILPVARGFYGEIAEGGHPLGLAQ